MDNKNINLGGVSFGESVGISNSASTKKFEAVLEIYKQRKEKRDKLKSKK